MIQPIKPISTAFITSPGLSNLTSPVNRTEAVAGSLGSENWDTVRWGIQWMVGSLCATALWILTMSVMPLLSRDQWNGGDPGFDLGGALLLLGLYAGALIGIGAYLVGVAMSLAAPRQANLGRPTWVCKTGFGGGALILLLAAIMSSGRSGRLRNMRLANYDLAFAGLLALAVGCAAYCFYMALIARRFGHRQLARGFLAFIPAVLFLFVWPSFALEIRIVERVLPVGSWQERLAFAEILLAAGLGPWWVGMLWLLQKRLGRSIVAQDFVPAAWKKRRQEPFP